ncbi:hypothetical protein J7K44_02095 [bacterium]|nr:hypothetical protein [bacterium]
MAITFIKEKKRQMYLTIIFIVLIIFIIGILWQGFFRKKGAILKLPSIETSVTSTAIEINFGILESEKLKELESFEPILPIEEEVTPTGEKIKVGRENPFLPYEIETTSTKEIIE